MKTATISSYCCPFCHEVHTRTDRCRESRQSTRDRKRREQSEHESRLHAGLSQMEGDGR